MPFGLIYVLAIVMIGTFTTPLPPEDEVFMGKIAYTTQGVLHILDLESGKTDVLEEGRAMWNPTWSPDGRTVAYGWGSIHQVELADGTPTLLIEGPAFPSYHPDGTRLAYTMAGGGLYVHDLPSDRVTKILDDALQPFQAAWSPDGSSIAFVGQTGQRRDIYLLDATCIERENCSQALTQLTDSGQYNHAPAWSPDGVWIAFERLDERSNSWSIWVMRADGTQARKISKDTVNEHHPSWSPDGAWLVVERETDQPGLRANLFLLSVDGQQERALTTEGGIEPEWWWPNRE